MIVNIISLPKRQDRRESIIKQMEQENVGWYRIWDGITHKQPKTGISRAHKQIIQYGKDENLKEVCGVEDDLVWAGSGAWKYFIDNKPKDFDLYIGSYYSGSHDENFIVSGFRGLTLYICHSRFFDKFLSLPETMHIDGALAVSGAKIVVSPLFVCRQAPGYSDQRKRYAENNLVGKQMYGQ